MTAEPVAQVGRMAVRFVYELGGLTSFSGRIAGTAATRPFRLRRILDEMYRVGVLSVPIIAASGVVVGFVLGLQGHNTLVRFGAEENVGAMVGLVLVRELGPVLTALLVTGRAGSSIAAEIGSMVVTEQLDGLRMMSIDPVGFVVKPKAVATILSMPLLSALFVVLGVVGGYLEVLLLMGGEAGIYFSSLQSAIEFREDVMGSLVKAFVFGVLVALISTYRGFTSKPHAAGVSAATTSTVVVASVTILVFNYFITALWRF